MNKNIYNDHKFVIKKCIDNNKINSEILKKRSE